MKTLLVTIFLITAACGVREPRVPYVCQRNMHDCLMTYNGNDPKFIKYGWTSWQTWCKEDLKVCESQWGIGQ